MLRRFAFVLPLLVGSAFVAGCDSNDSEEPGLTDAERLVGAWSATAVSVDGEVDTPVGPVSDSVPLDLSGDGSIEMTFTADQGYTLVAQGPITADVPILGEQEALPAGPPVTLSGTFVVDEGARELDFTGDQTGAVTFEVPYSFSGDDELRFVLESSDLIVALLTDAGADPALASIVQGGSMTLARR